MRDDDPRLSPDWLPDQAIEALNTERAFRPEEGPEDTARRIFLENAPAVASAICHIALFDANSRIRLDAAKYVTNRCMGNPGEDLNVGKGSPLDEALRRMQEAAEVHANRNAGGE